MLEFNQTGYNPIKVTGEMSQGLKDFGRAKEKPAGILERLKEFGVNIKDIFMQGYREKQEEMANTEQQDYNAMLEHFYEDVERLKENIDEAEKAELTRSCEEAIETLRNLYEEQKDSRSEESKEKFLAKLHDMEQAYKEAKDFNTQITEEPAVLQETEMPDIFKDFDEPDLDLPLEPQGEKVSDIIDEDEVETQEQEPEEAQEKTEESEPIDIEPVQEEIADEPIEEQTSDLDDLTQFTTYSEYLTAYRQTRIDLKDADRFYNDYILGNLPSDLLDEKSFKEARQRMIDEIEYRKLEAENAETEKALREIEEKQAALSEQHAELQARFEDRDAKLAALRKDNVDLRKEIVDKDRIIENKDRETSDLKGQLEKAQEVAKQSQAAQYDAVEAFHRLEKEVARDKKRVAELEAKLANSERDAEAAKEELKQTKARISENTEAALKQINSLRTENDDDIEKTALDWAEMQLKKGEQAPKEGPKHLKEEPAEEPKPEKKKTKKKSEKKDEDLVQEPNTEAPNEETMSQTDLDKAVRESMEITDSQKVSEDDLTDEIEAARQWGEKHNDEYSPVITETTVPAEDFEESHGMSR